MKSSPVDNMIKRRDGKAKTGEWWELAGSLGPSRRDLRLLKSVAEFKAHLSIPRALGEVDPGKSDCDCELCKECIGLE